MSKKNRDLLSLKLKERELKSADRRDAKEEDMRRHPEKYPEGD